MKSCRSDRKEKKTAIAETGHEIEFSHREPHTQGTFAQATFRAQIKIYDIFKVTRPRTSSRAHLTVK